jgi:hypothetical protein
MLAGTIERVAADEPLRALPTPPASEVPATMPVKLLA